MANKKASAVQTAPQLDLRGILKKKISEITPQEWEALEKPLGTLNCPYPMWGTDRTEHDGRSERNIGLSFIASDMSPMLAYSERTLKEVIALSYCDMPVPSMLDLFYQGLERRRPQSTNRAQMMIGNPGHGKSYLGALQSRLRSREKADIFDCGGKNMNELLFEMVLDFGAAEALPKAIDRRLLAADLQPTSMQMLKKLPNAALSLDSEGHIQSIDWGYFKSGLASHAEVEEAFHLIERVARHEGLDNQGGNALGMNSQYGPLVRAFIEGKEIVLDEYNKSKEGSDNALQTVWQFIIGEINVCTVDNPLKNKDSSAGPSTFTFRRDDMRAGFFVTLTGNKTEDGTTTRSLNKSVYSRLSPVTLPDPQPIDWQHRICQMMVGMPVSTIYQVFQKDADKDPEAFGKWLIDLRRTKAEIEGVPVPELQETLLKNWKSVVRATEKLAKFYSEWAALTDVEVLMSRQDVELSQEVDDEYTKKEGIDFRKIKQHLEEAIPVRPHMEPIGTVAHINFGDYAKKPVVTEKVEETPSLNFGTRLTDFLDQMVYLKTEALGMKKLYARLCRAMDEAGLRDVVLAEGEHSEQRSVEEDLNISAFDSTDITLRSQLAQKTLCDYIRQMDPEIVEDDNNKIVTIQQMRSALQEVARKNRADKNELYVVNREHQTLRDHPLTVAHVFDAIEGGVETEVEEISLSEVVSYEDLLASLALPDVGAHDLSALWDNNLSLLSKNKKGSDKQSDEAMEIAENRSSSGIATTSVYVSYGDEATLVHLVTNKQRGKTLVVGEKVPSKLESALKEAGVIVIDRRQPNAKAKVDSAISELTRGSQQEATKMRLRPAFTYRAAIAKDDTRKLSELMIDPELGMEFQKVLMKGPKKRLTL